MYDEKLAEVLCETAEQIFFQEFKEVQHVSVPDSVFWACVAVRSPSRFELVVGAARDEVRGIMATMFPTENELTDEQVADVVAELANTIAGSLARLIDDDADIDLSPPGKGLGLPPQVATYHTYACEDIKLQIAVRDLNSNSPASISARPLSADY